MLRVSRVLTAISEAKKREIAYELRHEDEAIRKEKEKVERINRWRERQKLNPPTPKPPPDPSATRGSHPARIEGEYGASYSYSLVKKDPARSREWSWLHPFDGCFRIALDCNKGEVWSAYKALIQKDPEAKVKILIQIMITKPVSGGMVSDQNSYHIVWTNDPSEEKNIKNDLPEEIIDMIKQGK